MPPMMGRDQIALLVFWMTLAFGLWLVFTDLVSRLRVPRPAFVAAPLSWICARLLIWAVWDLVRQIDQWRLL